MSTAKLWARLFRGKYESNSLAMVDKTRAIIKNLVVVERDVALGVSFLLQDRWIDSDRFPPPYYMLISGLTLEQTKYLTNLEVVLTKEATLLFTPFKEPHPTFIMTIYGLTYTNPAEAQEEVSNLVKGGICNSEAVMKHILDSAPSRTGS